MATPVGGAPASVVVGEQTLQPDANPQSAGIAEAYPATASATGAVTSISVYVDAPSTALELVAGLYADNGGHPGTLLAQGSLEAPVAGWNTIAVASTPVAAGTTYWIALLPTSGILVFRDRCCTVAGTGPTETNAQAGLVALPAQWTTGTVYDDAPMSAYASG
jgi:hypothetical protein